MSILLPSPAVAKDLLARRVAQANRDDALFKGKIGERDMGRLIYLAALADDEVEF